MSIPHIFSTASNHFIPFLILLLSTRVVFLLWFLLTCINFLVPTFPSALLKVCAYYEVLLGKRNCNTDNSGDHHNNNNNNLTFMYFSILVNNWVGHRCTLINNRLNASNSFLHDSTWRRWYLIQVSKYIPYSSELLSCSINLKSTQSKGFKILA